MNTESDKHFYKIFSNKTFLNIIIISFLNIFCNNVFLDSQSRFLFCSYKRMLSHPISPLINSCHFREPRSGERFCCHCFHQFPTCVTEVEWSILDFFEAEYRAKLKKTLIIFCHFGTKWFRDRVNQEMTGINQG